MKYHCDVMWSLMVIRNQKEKEEKEVAVADWRKRM